MKNEMLVDDAQTGASERANREPDQTQARKRRSKTHPATKIAGVLVGRLVDLEQSAGPRVDFPGNSSTTPVPALSILKLDKDAVGRQVVLMFEEGDPQRPVVMGLVEDRDPKIPQSGQSMPDKTRLEFTAQEQIVLRCGQSSITLTRAGKVLIRGAYILTRSSGVNRIKGGSVQIN